MRKLVLGKLALWFTLFIWLQPNSVVVDCVAKSSNLQSENEYYDHGLTNLSRRLEETPVASTSNVRAALIVTLAGSRKLAPYFEWSCATFGSSRGLFDMLVFHESNAALLALQCPDNVKFIDLGPQGLSKLLVNKILEGADVDKAIVEHLQRNVDRIITHIPRYLVEVKPMMGQLFDSYLQSYTHWSYTDPDIIWGNLADWIPAEDLQQYDLLSIAKNNDAGRLFLRGQVRTPYALRYSIRSFRGLMPLYL